MDFRADPNPSRSLSAFAQPRKIALTLLGDFFPSSTFHLVTFSATLVPLQPDNPERDFFLSGI